MRNTLIIEGTLSEPPSSIACFRDVTLWARLGRYEDVLVVCQKGARTLYRDWLRSRGALDFISYIMHAEEDETGFWLKEKGSKIRVPYGYGLEVKRLTAETLPFIMPIL